MSAAESIADTGRAAPVRFTGANVTFRWLVERGALLELITFGFYRFWLTTDIRRHLWSNTEVDGDAMEYTGRGKELLLGFLVALAVLMPIYLLYFLIGIEAERYKTFASLPLYAFFYLFLQFAVYRARRYRLTRTIWRGVRFWMTGSGWSYAWRSCLWALLLIPTIGFAYPWRTAALERYKFGHTFYGTLPGGFVASGGQLFKRIWWVWLLGLLPVIAIFGGTIAATIAKRQGFGNTTIPMIAAGLIIVIGVVLLIALPFLHAVRMAMEWRWWAEGIRFGEVTVTCGLSPGALIGIYWALIGMGLVVLLAFAMMAGGITVVVSRLPWHIGGVAALGGMAIWTMALYAICYLATILAFGVIARIFVLHHVWRRVINACSLHNAEAAADVASAGEAANAIGEGLVDGLDFAGF